METNNPSLHQTQGGSIHQKHFGDQLGTLSEQLTDAVAELASGRTVRVSSSLTAPTTPRVQFEVRILDEALDTPVERQGHGFQRALLIAALKLLAERGRGTSENGVICLAIEEPELYQHPLQARSFAAVLRSLAEQADQGVQVAYATHSPYFIEARSFHQIRRVSRHPRAEGGTTVTVVGSSVDRVIDRLDGYVHPDKIRRQLDSVCMGDLGEGFFADVVVLVEGSTERAVLTGVAARDSVPLLIDGIFVGEAGGKTGLLLPHVILNELGIPSYLVADNDSHLGEELEEAEEAGDLDRVRKLRPSVKDSVEWNHKLLRFFELPETDLPVGRVAPNITFVDGGLERALAEMWPAWAATRQDLIDEGVGFSGKDSATYQEAAMHADGEVPEVLTLLIVSARELRLAA